MEHSYETTDPIELYVESGSGLITLTASEVARTDVTVTGRHADDFVVERSGDQLQVVAPRTGMGFLAGEDHAADITVVMPVGSTVTVKTGSADLRVHGPVAALWVNSGSGQIGAEVVDGVTELTSGSGEVRMDELRGAARIKSGSGPVSVARCADLTVSSGSGDVTVDSVGGRLVVKTGSGDVQVGEAADDLSVSTGSGDLSVEVARKGRYLVRGASGNVHIGVPAGTPVWTDITTLSGRVRSDLPPTGAPVDGQDHLEINATTVSGDVTLQGR